MVHTLLTSVLAACIATHARVQAFVGPARSSNWQTDFRLNAATITTRADGKDEDFILETDVNSPYLLFPGGGLFFYWQAGVVSYLREQDGRYNIDDLQLGGASAGALTATLTAANVDFYEATDLALRMAKEAGIWDRKEGLQGIWGPLISDWLDELLPDDVLDRVNNRLSLLVTEIPTFKKIRVDTFPSRKDLIDCNMASVHLPWFLDGNLTASFREAQHIDGSFFSQVSDFGVTTGDQVVMPDYQEDPAMSSALLDFVKAVSPDSIYEMLEKGKAYGKVMEDLGQFKELEISMLTSLRETTQQ